MKKSSVVLKLLEKQLANKQKQLDRLERENRRLQQEHALLVGCCDGLQLMRLQDDEQQAVPSAAVAAATAGEPQPLGQAELQLLEQLANTPYSNSASSSAAGEGIASCTRPETTSSSAEQQPGSQTAAAPAMDPTSEPLAPPDDPMRYFRYLISLPAASIPPQFTAADLASDYAKTVSELALQLHLVHDPVLPLSPGQKGHFQRLTMAVDRHHHLLATLLLQQRPDIVQNLWITNFETFEIREEIDIGRHSWALTQLGLSDQQKASIAYGVTLCDRLVEAVLQEQQLQRQQITGGSQDGGQDLGHKQQLHLQSKHIDRLTMLFGKEHMLRLAASAWVLGGLTYTQVAKLCVLMAPFPPSYTLLAKLVAAELQQEQRQQMPQRQWKQRKIGKHKAARYGNRSMQ